MLCRDTLSSVDDIEEGLDLPTVSPGSLSKSSAFSRIAESQYYAASAKLCVNPSNLTSDRVGSIVTVKHIEVQLANLQHILGSTKPKM